MSGSGWMTEAEFASKIDDEGGVYSALQYGLKASELKDQRSEMADVWRRLEMGFREMQVSVDRLSVVLKNVDWSAMNFDHEDYGQGTGTD